MHLAPEDGRHLLQRRQRRAELVVGALERATRRLEALLPGDHRLPPEPHVVGEAAEAGREPGHAVCSTRSTRSRIIAASSRSFVST